MRRSGRLGFLLCLIAFIGICVAAILLSRTGPFGGMQGLENDLATKAAQRFEATAPETQVTAEGQNLTITLPERVAADFDRTALERDVGSIKGVRSVALVGDPAIAVVDGIPAPRPTPTATPSAEPDEPAPAATPDVEPEPTAIPLDTAPSLDEVLGQLNLGGVLFETGTATLTGVDRAVLYGVAANLEGFDGAAVEVQAHTNNLGDPDVNLLLSQDRAQAIVDFLNEQGATVELTARGYGASKPIADNSTEEGRATNERVALVSEGN